MGTPGRVAPASTMKMLPDMYREESWIKYRTRDVNAGSDVPKVRIGHVLWATVLSQSFCIRPEVISDLNSPGAIAFALILYAPNSRAITWNCHYLEQKKSFFSARLRWVSSSVGIKVLQHFVWKNSWKWQEIYNKMSNRNKYNAI